MTLDGNVEHRGMVGKDSADRKKFDQGCIEDDQMYKHQRGL